MSIWSNTINRLADLTQVRQVQTPEFVPPEAAWTSLDKLAGRPRRAGPNDPLRFGPVGRLRSDASAATPVPHPMDRLLPEPRSAYRHFREIGTQWRDNDQYGHVNNAVHYAWFDTLVNAWLIENGLLQPAGGEVLGLVVSTSCQYFSEASFPDRIHGGLRVERLGSSSVTYGLGLFRNDAPETFSAGRFVHVYVDSRTRRPVALPAGHAAALRTLLVTPPAASG